MEELLLEVSFSFFFYAADGLFFDGCVPNSFTIFASMPAGFT